MKMSCLTTFLTWKLNLTGASESRLWWKTKDQGFRHLEELSHTGALVGEWISSVPSLACSDALMPFTNIKISWIKCCRILHFLFYQTQEDVFPKVLSMYNTDSYSLLLPLFPLIVKKKIEGRYWKLIYVYIYIYIKTPKVLVYAIPMIIK